MAYDPTTDVDPGYDIEGHTAADDDMGQQEQREQAAVSLRRVTPEVYSPTPAPAPRPHPQRQGITPYEPKSNRPPADGTYIIGDEEYGYRPDPSAPVTGKVTWKDYGDQLVASALGSAGAIAGGVSWLQHQINSDPQYRAYADNVKDFAEQHAAATLNGMSDKAKQVLRASLFGSDRDAEGNAIPSPGDVGWGSYIAMHAIGMIPDAAAMLLPGGILGRVAVKGLEIAGGTARAIKAGETVATLTKAGETAKAVGHGVGTAGYFSAENGGQLANTIGNEIRDAKDADLQSGSEVYKHFRDSGMDVDTAKRELFKQSTAMIVGAFAAGAVGGGGFGVLGKGVVRGAIAGAGAMGIQGGATQALQQGAERAMGTRQDYDLSSIMSDTLTSGGMGLVLGGVGGRFAGRAKPGVDPAVGEAFRTYDEPAGPPEAGPGRVIYPNEPPGPQPPPQADLGVPPVPPGGTAARPQAEMFTPQEQGPRVQPGQPAPEGAPPAVPPQYQTAAIGGEGERTPGYRAPQPPSPALDAQGNPIQIAGVGESVAPVPPPTPGGLTGAPAPPQLEPVSRRSGGIPGATQQDLPINQTPPTMVRATDQGQLFPSLPEANPPVQRGNVPMREERGEQPPPGAPPAGGGGVSPRVAGARPRAPKGEVPPGVPVEVSPTGEARVPGAPTDKGALKKSLVDKLTGVDGAPTVQKLRRMKTSALKELDAQLAKTSTPTQPDTTVVTGADRTPASETLARQGPSEDAAPPVSGEALTPPVTPEGVRKAQPKPTAKPSTTGLTEGLSGAARAIGENLRNMLWAKHEAGDTTEAGKPSNILRASTYLKERGVITDRASFEKFLNDYGAAQKAGELKTKAGSDKFFEKQLTGREPAPEVRSEGGPSPDTMAKSGEGIAPKQEAPVKRAPMTKEERAAVLKAKQEAVAKGAAFERGAAHVEAPTEGERVTPEQRAQEIATREQTREAARSEAITKVRDALERATVNVMPLKKGSTEAAPAIARALRDLVESVGRTDGSMDEVAQAVGQFARDHKGRITGTDTSWFEIGDRIHKELTGRSLPEREEFAHEAGQHVEAQPRSVESETQKRSAEREEATTTKEQDIAREEAHEAGATPEETSTGMTAAPETTAKKIAKGTSADVKGRQFIEKAIDPNDPMTALEADRLFGGQNQGKGRKRLAGNKDIVTVAQKMLAEANKFMDGIVESIRKNEANKNLTPKVRAARSKALMDEMAKSDPERISRLEQFIREVSDPVADSADKLAAMKSDLAKRTGDLPVHEQRVLSPLPKREGIPPESSTYIKGVRDPALNQHLMNHVDNAEFNGGTASLHGMLDAIINHAATKQNLRPLWELARRMRSLVGDIPVVSPEAALKRGWLGMEQYVDLFASNRKVNAYHTTGGRGGRSPEHIVLNSSGGTHTETLLHEAMHAATSRYIDRLLEVDPNHQHIEVLRAIGRELRDQAEKALTSEDYLRFHHDLEGFTQSALTNPHEVHAWLMTNSVLQDFAARTVASPEFRARMMELGYGPRPQGRSVWRAFTDWVQRALGYNKPESASETAFLDHILRPLQDITEVGAKYNEHLLPHDPAVRAQAEPLYQDLGTAFRRGAGEVFDRVDPVGLGAKARGLVFSTAPADRLIERYEHLAQAGDRNHLRDVRTAYEKAQVTTAGFLRDFGDRARNIARALRGKDEVASLMNDVGYARVALGTADDVAANAHLTTPEERGALAEAQRRFNALPAADQQLYKTTRDFGVEKYAREREATANRQINDWLPHGTDAERAFLRTAMRTKAGMEAYLANPDNPAIDASRRVIARGLVKLHLDGFVPGDYFPMRRYGDYVVEYGEHGTPSYGMQKFESMAKAEAFRREAANNGLNPQSVREADAIVQHGLMRPSAAIQEMLDKINVTPELREHGPQLREMVTKLQLQYASTAERARARRRGVAGASKDIGRAIQDDTAASALRVGSHEHGGERDAAMRALKFHGDELARTNEKGAFTLDQVRHEFERRFGIGDDGGWKGASGLARKLTSFGYAHTLMSFSRVAVETAELHLKMGAFIGARHGPARAALEMGRALKDISPSLWTKGMSNTAKAFIGKPLSSVDYQLGEMARQRLLDKGYNPTEVNGFFKHFHENGLFDQTTAQALKELARPSNMGKAFNWFVDVSSAMSHASEESNRIAGTWAAFRAERASGKSIAEANRFAEDTLRKAPNFNPTNRPRISSDKGILGKFSAPIMQFKMYGLNEHWMLANLARDVISRSTDPAKRKEAIYGLAGTIAAHSMLAGVLTWYTDPARYIGGAYDLITGQKPHDRTLDARKWLADSIGPTWGEILGRGAPHAIGIDSSHRSGVGNMLNIPDMNGFTPKDWALFVGQVFMGAPGEDATRVAEGVGKAVHGNYLAGIVEMLPRILRDPVKAYGYSQYGVTDTRGKTILPPEKISPWSIAVQAAGFVPSEVSEAREKRTAIMQTRDRMQAEHADLTNRWVNADPADRAAIMSEIRQWNADPANIGARIQTSSLLQALQRHRKESTREGAYGLTLPKKGAQQMLEAGRF